MARGVRSWAKAKKKPKPPKYNMLKPGEDWRDIGLRKNGWPAKELATLESLLNPGDTVMIPPNVQHWHGAAPDRLFAHMAMSENSDTGAGTSWGEHVSDAEYTAPVA